MISKKLCMIGAFSVGKTSLVQRYVHSIFSDTYLSTIGVKISKSSVDIDGQQVDLILWDMEGKDDFVEINMSHLRGAMGLIIVADGTRAETLDIALQLRATAFEHIGTVPYRLLINKADLATDWEITEKQLEDLRNQGVPVQTTSAKTGDGVNEAFAALARAML